MTPLSDSRRVEQLYPASLLFVMDVSCFDVSPLRESCKRPLQEHCLHFERLKTIRTPSMDELRVDVSTSISIRLKCRLTPGYVGSGIICTIFRWNTFIVEPSALEQKGDRLIQDIPDVLVNVVKLVTKRLVLLLHYTARMSSREREREQISLNEIVLLAAAAAVATLSSDVCLFRLFRHKQFSSILNWRQACTPSINISQY